MNYQDCYEILSEPYVATAYNIRNRYLHFDQIVFTLEKEGYELSDKMKEIITEHWVPFILNAVKHLTAISAVPVVLQKISYKDEDGKTKHTHVPVCPDNSLYRIEATNDVLVQTHEIKSSLNYTDKEIKFHLIKSSNSLGMDSMTGIIHSNCGRLVKLWKELKADREFDRLLKNKALNPTIYFEKPLTSTSKILNDDLEKTEELIRIKIGVQFDDKPPAIVYTDNNTQAKIPDGFQLCSRQPLPDFKIFDIDKRELKFCEMVDAEFGMSYNGLGQHSTLNDIKTGYAIDEERRIKHAAISQLSNDLSRVIKKVYKLIYPDEKINVVVPQRTFVNIDAILSLYHAGLISSKKAMEEIQQITGLKEERHDLFEDEGVFSSEAEQSELEDEEKLEVIPKKIKLSAQRKLKKVREVTYNKPTH